MDSVTLSGNNLANGIEEVFKDSENEVSIASVKLAPMLYMDNCMHLSDNIDDAQAGLTKLKQVAESKLLNYNLKKTTFVVVGDATAKKKLEEQLKKKPLMFYNTPF